MSNFVNNSDHSKINISRINIPRIVIAGTHSGVGKTSIVAGLLASYSAMGIRVAAFKCGPDYLDPTYHRRALQDSKLQDSNLQDSKKRWMGCNLDSCLTSDQVLRESFVSECLAVDAELAIIEGVMGLFDGKSTDSDLGSTASIAKLLSAPV
ncbi:MAG: AAA family ATPase, partial [Oligoflexia bacterium]|nr:AAA family ATPase [Oligoflexia bacterium]